jgi:hypothetical protein
MTKHYCIRTVRITNVHILNLEASNTKEFQCEVNLKLCEDIRKTGSLSFPFNIEGVRIASKIICLLSDVFALLRKLFSYYRTCSLCFENKFLSI